MKVSAIVPAYNAEHTISETLQSLLKQTFTEWEAIVVNDGSTDRTVEVVEEFVRQDSRIRLFNQENQGLSGARNSGVKLATYDWLLFLDSDDWIFPQHLERLTESLLADQSLDAAYCGWTYALPDGEYVLPQLPAYTGDLFVPFAQGCVSIVHTFLVRRSLVKALGCFNTSLKSCEDWLLWQRIARTGARFGTVQEVLAAYRTRPNSLSRNGVQLLQDGTQVLTQGHSPAPDLPSSHPVYPNGLPLEQLPASKFYLLCACAGYLIGGGKDACQLFHFLEGEQCTTLVPYDVAHSIFVHAMVSASKPRSQWRSVWQNCQANLAAFLTALESHSGTPNLASRTYANAHLLIEKYAKKDNLAQQLGSIPSELVLLKQPLSYSIYMQKQWIKRSIGAILLVSPLVRNSAKQIRRLVAAPKSIAKTHPSHSPKEYFEDLFVEVPDPWNYTNAYEQLKYEQTLTMLPKEPIKTALELGCAEGHFTVQFAPKVGHLLATDVSQVALDRCQQRCAAHTNIQYQCLDLQADSIPGQFDLIVCSEMLYFMGDRSQLKAIAHKLAAGLKPGGYLLTTHSNVLIDEPNGSGFEWGHAFGAKCIGETFASCRSLEFIHELRTPLYRIQLFQRRQRPAPLLINKSPKQLQLLDASEYRHLPPQIAAGLRFGAATHLPIFSYRCVGPDSSDSSSVTPESFEAQLDYLCNAGCYSASLEEWGYGVMGEIPLKERAITILFENCDQRFLTYAWPLLKQYGLSATLLICADEIGKLKTVDQGQEISLMEWQEIRRLQAEGVSFASHFRNQPDLASLSIPQVWSEIKRSREALQNELAIPVSTFVYPSGRSPVWLQYLVAACGYSFGITEKEGLCSSQRSLLTLPRIKITSSDSPESLITKLNIAIPNRM